MKNRVYHKELKDVCVTTQSITKNIKIPEIILLHLSIRKI